MTDKLDITLNVNGRDLAVRVEPRRTLADTIRDECGLTGTHLGCEHGVCGACTVIVDGEAVRSCLMFAVQAQGKTHPHGRRAGERRHAASAAARVHRASRPAMRFCTPGFLMLAVNTLERQPDIGDEELLDVLASNLCRCTGYQNIVKAVKAARAEMRAIK